jgi:hypothetical protein
MSKYQLLSRHLAARPGDEWSASFSELEALLGFPLPKAARAGRGWWANDPAKGHARAWSAQGWEVGDVDYAAEWVVFRRGAASGQTLVEAARLKPLREGGEVQPAAMLEAAETASAQMHATRGLGVAALVSAGVAVAVGLGAMLVRGALRRR